ncbi:MAG TPA: pirin family protein [Burkholderiaceae bacterium]|nr:pirin family protein [Burkholderiaceae bacterium]
MTVTVLEPARRELSPGFAVRRALPVATRRTVGPFVFFDHFGPVALARAEDADVRPHPHIGLATVTWLFDGEILHRDSLGSVQPIRPGEVNWMVAGRGIVHSERASPGRRGTPARSHGLQVWVGLPRSHEDAAPSFVHVPAADVPVHAVPGARLSVVAGDAWGLRSPVPVASRTLYAVGTLDPGATIAMPGDHLERAAYVVEGAIELDGTAVPAGRLATVEPGAPAVLRSADGARVALFGGDPLDGPRFVWWNFVASDRDRIEAAKARWRDDAFGRIDGETERIPLPD